MKAQAILFPQPEAAVCQEVELPAPTPRDIVVDTELSGVSIGTERWAYLGKRAEIKFPNVPGYMAVGTIVETGAEAVSQGWIRGQRVYYWKTRFADELEQNSWMGSHTSRAVIDVCGAQRNPTLATHHCEKVPAGCAPDDVVLTGLCGVALRGIEMAVVPAGAQVLVCGAGVIGQYAIQVATLKGAHVTALDLVESRLAAARLSGAHTALNSRDPGTRDQLEKIAPNGFDIIIDTSSSAAVVNSLFPLLKLRGKFVFQGWYPPPTPLDLHALHLRLPSAYFPCAHSGEAVATAMEWAARGLLKSRQLITHRFAPEQAAEIYRSIANPPDDLLGVVIEWKKANRA